MCRMWEMDMATAEVLNWKGVEVLEPWVTVDGVPIPATKIRRLVLTSSPIAVSSFILA